jgi:hypothetical protein
MATGNKERINVPLCVARLDRLIVAVRKAKAEEVPAIKGYKVVRDTRVQRQSAVSTYQRVRQLRSATTASQIFIQYKPVQGYLPGQRITMVADDKLGITPKEIEDVIGAHFRNHQVSLAEIALDFTEDSGIDEEFVLKFGKFGKTRRRRDRGGEGTLRYGSRTSPKMIRCYRKIPLGSYRVEVELHSALLRKYSITNVGQLYMVASRLASRHVRFVRIDWKRLETPLRRRLGPDCREVLAEARRRADISSGSATRFLGRRIPNVHRYLKPLLINRDVRAALKTWAEEFFLLEQLFPVPNAEPKSKRRRVA